MEPITALLVYSVLTPALATVTPKWGVDANPNTHRLVAERVNYISPEYVAAGASDAIYPFSQNQFPDQASRIISILKSYRTLGDGWSGDGSVAPEVESVDAAIKLIEDFPAGIGLPSPMVSFDGEVGFYWSSAAGYISMDIESKEHASLYILNRKTGADHFEDGIVLTQCDRTWYKGRLSALEPQLRAAA